MKTGTLLRMALAAVWLWCSQSVRAAETFSDPEGSPAEMDFFSWEKLQEKAKENQENFRKRVAIPEAVGPELKVENGARPSLAAPLELQPETLLFAAMFFLAAMLA